jgi:hypothetical protein
MMKYLFSIFLVAACSSKQPQQLTEKAKNLEIYLQKPNQCRVVGKVVGVNEIGSVELATNDALNQAADLKATGIFVNQEVPNGQKRSVHATAYECD